jgi:enoyl-CoA hydratase/carnithine racemase
MQYVKFQRDGNVAVITLDKPPHNTMDKPLLAGVMQGFRQAAEEGCRAILLRSAMRHFCAGAVLASFTLDDFEMRNAVAGLEDIGLPSVAAVSGSALGGGLELALMCDFIVAADTATMGLPEVSLGLVPFMGGVQRLALRAGAGRAKEMAMLGRRHDAATLLGWGVVNVVAPETELQSAAMAYARQLASGPTVALRAVKSLADAAARGGCAAADALQDALNHGVMASADARAGIAAFAATGRPGSTTFEGS